jgi:hypothetical protein
MTRIDRLTDALRDRRKAVAFVGAAAALAGAGSVSAATMASAASPPAAHEVAAVRHTTAGDSAVRTVAVRRAPAAAKPAKPYEIYDSVTPSQIPAGHDVATYADGSFAVPTSAVSGKHVLWIDTNGSDPKAGALDVEPGDSTPAGAAAWAHKKLAADPGSVARIYTMRSEWPAVKSAVAALPASMQSHVRWWIADPTGVPHVVPGSSATQWYWGSNYDITTATPSF